MPLDAVFSVIWCSLQRMLWGEYILLAVCMVWTQCLVLGTQWLVLRGKLDFDGKVRGLVNVGKWM